MAKREKPGVPWIIPAGLAALFTSAVFLSPTAASWISARVPVLPPAAPLQLPERAYQDALTAQEWSAFAGLAAASVSLLTLLVSTITLIILALTLFTTRRMLVAAQDTVDLTRSIGRAQTRSYISLAVLDWHYEWASKTPSLTIKYGNSGNSPALLPELIIRVHRTIFYGDARPAVASIYIDPMSLPDIPASYPDTEKPYILGAYRLADPEDLTFEQADSISFQVEVSMIYRDVFGERHFAYSGYVRSYGFQEGIIVPTLGLPSTAFLHQRPTEDIFREHLVFSRRHNPG